MGGEGVETTRVSRDLSKLSKTGKLQVLMTDSPELLTLLEEFKEKLGELRERVEPLVPLARQGGAPHGVKLTDEGIAYLEVKHQLLLNYCLNLTYYMLLKAEGKPIKDHPVITQLLELRTALEKMRPLDAKLKYQIDRLLKVAAAGENDGAGGGGMNDPLSFRPNPDALMGKMQGGGDGDEEEGEEEGEDAALNGGGDGGGAGGVYRPPRLAAVPYEEEGAAGKRNKEEAKARKSLEKLRRSELMQTITEQFSDKPELVADRGPQSSLERKQAEAEDERRKYEEERFIRLVTSKKEKKARRAAEQQASRLETIADIGDFQELQSTLQALNQGGGGSMATSKAAAAAAAREGGLEKQSKSLSALQKAVNSLAQREESKKKRRRDGGGELEGDVDVPYRNPDEIRVRRPVPEEGEGGGGEEEYGSKKKSKKAGSNKRGGGEQASHSEADEYFPPPRLLEEDPFYEATAAKKAKKKADKAALYAVEPTYGALEEELAEGPEGEKRGINYQILKNRGLTPYKSKLNRNPRVKKREAYRKAVIRRKGQVRDVRASEMGGYGGEATGINAKVVRVRGKK